MNKLENDFLIIETSKAGAELTRIFSKALNKEKTLNFVSQAIMKMIVL